jgi:hypothetical protein
MRILNGRRFVDFFSSHLSGVPMETPVQRVSGATP